MQHATINDATCTACRCTACRSNARADATRTDATRTYATCTVCNARRCNLQPAPMQTYIPHEPRAPHAPWEHRAATRLRRYICLKTCFLRATRRLRIADGERSGTVHPPVASAQLWSTARPNGSPPSPNDRKRVLTYAPLQAACNAQRTTYATHCSTPALHRARPPSAWHAQLMARTGVRSM